MCSSISHNRSYCSYQGPAQSVPVRLQLRERPPIIYSGREMELGWRLPSVWECVCACARASATAKLGSHRSLSTQLNNIDITWEYRGKQGMGACSRSDSLGMEWWEDHSCRDVLCVCAHIYLRVINSTKIKASHIKHTLNAMSVKYPLWYEWSSRLSFRADIFPPRLYFICKPLKMSSKAQEAYSWPGEFIRCGG